MIDRKQIILDILTKKEKIGITDLLIEVNNLASKKVSKITIIRDLDNLIENNLVMRTGKGPTVKYKLPKSYTLFKDINVDNYFFNDPDNREATNAFNFDIFDLLSTVDLFNKSEIEFLDNLNKKYQKNIANLPPEIIKKEFERLMIELSWKSSKIEGNTYDILETEFLIKENREAKGHTKLEALMILNHKDALNLIKKEKIKKISLQNIKTVHNELTKEMKITNDIRDKPVGITGTIYKPLQKRILLEKAIHKLCELINNKNNIFEKSLLLNLLIAYIQPFIDGNKRTSRLMGNAILMANNCCPLSFRSIDELDYKKSIIIFYEQNNLAYFKKLFIDQYEFAVENYFRN